MKLVELNRKQYQDYELVFEYDTDEHYAVTVTTGNAVMGVELKREKLPETLHKRFAENLFQRYLARPSVYAVEVDGVPVAFLEIDREFWSKRLRIADLLVLPGHRRCGYGAQLVGKAKEIAKKEGFRAIYLDTHTCNVKAIDFYLSQGFGFGGVDTTFYSNMDIERGEVYVELVYVYRDTASMEWRFSH